MRRRIRGVRGGSRHCIPDISDRWGSRRSICYCMLERMLSGIDDELKIPTLVALSNGGLISFFVNIGPMFRFSKLVLRSNQHISAWSRATLVTFLWSHYLSPQGIGGTRLT